MVIALKLQPWLPTTLGPSSQPPWLEGGWGNSELINKLLSVSDTKIYCIFSLAPERDTKGKILCIFQGIGKFILLLGFLYLFVCSLDVLSSAFQLVGGTDERVKGLGVRGVLIWSRPSQPSKPSLAAFKDWKPLRLSCEVMHPFYRRENRGL